MISLRRITAGEYTAEAAGATWQIVHGGPDCWSFYRDGDAGSSDACNTLAEVREALGRKHRDFLVRIVERGERALRSAAAEISYRGRRRDITEGERLTEVANALAGALDLLRKTA